MHRIYFEVDVSRRRVSVLVENLIKQVTNHVQDDLQVLLLARNRYKIIEEQ